MGVTAPVARRPAHAQRAGRTGDRIMRGLCALAGIIVAVVLIDLGYQMIHNSAPAITRFGIGFFGHEDWAPNFARFGAADMIYGTAVSSAIALLIAAPLGIAIAIWLAMIAPRRVSAVIGPVIEMLAAVPSIIYGFWGLIVLAPFIQKLEPGLHSALGWIPLFGEPQTTGISMLAAAIVLTLMILPIQASLCRDLFLTVPRELKEGAEALGSTRWEVIRGIVIPSTLSGVTAATVLALGRALGEAIAVSLVIGDANGIHANLFLPASTLAERIANQFPSSLSKLHTASMFYAGTVLLLICLLTSILARVIAGRFDVERRYARAVT